MTNETKIWLKNWLLLLFFPITGLYYLLKDCKTYDYNNFMAEWFWYLMMLIIWCGFVAVVGFGIWGLIYHFNTAIFPVSIIGGIVFVFFILPTIIHKFIHRK